ncbi:prohead protease/major capsid protein fusion protein [Desulfobotulus sp.]|uniref:prohead protease/major capsid protein fusion protein n=1 Tax=Desulfobotulus sp. TaxID=1940337 RepID=UPI002A369B76|nr:prohead protease/major capsid protein fusion protein [Desulfobotulus sp.]MDY0164300.1 HK97 family phage prohead protease [Desulfobotulus sp.]
MAEKILTRAMAATTRAPASLDADARTVDLVIATDTDAVTRWDYGLGGYVPEILIPSGFRAPASGQVPLLDSHERWSVRDVCGSIREIKIDGQAVVGRASYASTDRGDAAFRLLQEGHLTDYSVGFRSAQEMILKKNETHTIDGRTYTGPCILVTAWEIREVSTCAIGADPNAKARSAGEGENMPAPVTAPETGAPETRSADPHPVPAASPAAPAPATPDPVAAERSRVAEIVRMCSTHSCQDIMDNLIATGTPIEAARAAVLDRIASTRAAAPSAAPAAGAPATETVNERDKFRAAALDGLALRCGYTVEAPAAGAESLVGYTLRELAREALIRSGDRRIPGDAMEMVGRAMSTSDLPFILGSTARRSLQAGWEGANETWSQWCATGRMDDFKIHEFGRISEFDNLDEIPEDGEYKHGSVDEHKESVKLATYGKMFSITRQAIINDDLGAMTDIPRLMGEAAARKIGDLPYAVLISNGKMGDGKALFHADHGNIGVTGAIGIAALTDAYKKMGLQKDMRGLKRLNIRPQYLLAPVSLMGTTEEFFKSDKLGAEMQVNIYAGNALTRIYEPRLDDDSATAWYLGALKGKTVKVFFLGGKTAPYMESRQGWNRDGVEYKVRIDAAAAPVDWRGLLKNAGA